MTRKTKLILNLLVIPLLAYTIYLLIAIPHVYGQMALGVLLVTLLFNFIPKKLIAVPLYVLGFGGSVFILIAAYTFNTFTENERLKFDIPTAVIFEESDYESARQKAEKEGKPIFVDFYTGWCSPCLAFTKNVLTDEEVGRFMNEAFINLKYDAEIGEGMMLAKRFNVGSYPTILVIDADENVLEDLAKNRIPQKEDMITVSMKYLSR